MVAWRVAKCLLTLKAQWQEIHPGAANPGFIGDAEHATRVSDHNPWVDDPASSVNVVTAGDFYHQPAKGADAGHLAAALKQVKDPRVKYVIWNRRIWSLARDSEGWRPYDGANPHTGHCHVSVSSTKSRYDDTRPWSLPGVTNTGDDMSAEDVKAIQASITTMENDLKTGIDGIAARLESSMKTAVEAAGRRWALYEILYGLETEDDREAAREAYRSARAAGQSEEESMAAAEAQLSTLRTQIKEAQANA